MSKKTIEQYFCDLCKAEATIKTVNYPVVFHTDQTEGRASKAYISQEKIDLCENCLRKVAVIHGWGAQGCNTFEIINEK